MTFSPQRLLAALKDLPAAEHYLVAFSGGMDSHVLLHALAALRESLDAGLAAIHVHHGLQRDAADWARQCAVYCERLAVPLEVVAVNARPAAGESPEAAARHSRYQAIAARLAAGGCLLTAHHQDDQAETLLLQLLRGGGPKGLAAMPRCAPFAQGLHARPLLDFSRAQLSDYARRHGLSWIDDPSNSDTGIARNYIRHRVMPLLQQRWPSATRTLARSAALCAEVASFIEYRVAALLPQVCDEHGALDVAALLEQEQAMQHQLIRSWLQQRALPLPTAAHLEQIVKALHAAADRNPLITWRGAEVRRYRGRLYALAAMAGATPLPRRLSWDLTAPLPLPEQVGGSLVAEWRHGTGLCLPGDGVEIRFRQGGERCRPAGRRHAHSLKKLFQEYAVPPWLRDRYPLIYSRDELIAVPGLFVCDEVVALEDGEGVQIRWVGHGANTTFS